MRDDKKRPHGPGGGHNGGQDVFPGNGGHGGHNGGGHNPPPTPPSVDDFYDRFSDKTPWVGNDQWLQSVRDRFEKEAKRARRDDHLTPRERARLQRLRNRATGAKQAHQDWKRQQGGAVEDFDQSAFDAMYGLLDEFGLGSLGGFLHDLIVDGTTDSASLMLALQNTNEWKTRFAGNEALRQAGLGVLSPAEYLATERSYAQVMKNYGLPQGFYDDPADFAKWIGHSVSATELQSRVAAYADLANREDPAIMQQLQSMGLSQGDLLAYFMDPDRAAPLIQKQYQTALLGGAARRSGVVADNEYLGHLSSLGVSEEQASQGYGAIGQSLDAANQLSSIYGVEFGQGDLEAEVFENNAASATKRKRLASQERASFSGSAGQSGIQKNTGGSY